MNKKTVLTVILSGFVLTQSLFAYQPNPTPTRGGLGGAAFGAIVGQAIGKDTKGTLIGAGIGALAGMGWGAYRQKQEKELRSRLANSQIQISRDGDALSLHLPGGVTFPTNKHSINKGFQGPLNEIAYVLSKYPESIIQISGFTDDTGDYNYNMNLSQKRASSVANYLTGQRIDTRRMAVGGYGPEYPIASNKSADGRARNRRVEIKILPPKKGR
ncbi:MAG: OmpA family protein [Fusobacteriaceae bacterium]